MLQFRDIVQTQVKFRHYFHSSSTFSCFIIKFPYNARSDWLKQRALSENRERVDDMKLAFKFLLQNFDKFDPNYKHPLCDSDKININELFVSSKYGSWRPSLTTVV